MAKEFIYVMKGLGKVYPPKRKVLDDIWLSFFPGAKIGVLGLNGAGKSTLLNVVGGLRELASVTCRRSLNLTLRKPLPRW